MNEHENWHLWWKRACMHVWICTHTYIYAQSGNCQMLENYTIMKTATHLLEVQTCGKLRWCMDKKAFLWNQNIPCVLTNSTVLMHTGSPNHRKGTHSKLCKFHAHGKAQKWGICLFTAHCPFWGLAAAAHTSCGQSAMSKPLPSFGFIILLVDHSQTSKTDTPKMCFKYTKYTNIVIKVKPPPQRKIFPGKNDTHAQCQI